MTTYTETPSTKHSVAASRVRSTHLVLPGDTNSMGNIFGGKVMEWIDKAAAIAAMRHCRTNVVTVSIDDLHFLSPVRLGEIVNMTAEVSFTGKTSMEIYVLVDGEDRLTGVQKRTTIAYLTFVALGANGKPTPVPQLIPETNEEKQRFAEAKQRRQTRLGRCKRP